MFCMPDKRMQNIEENESKQSRSQGGGGNIRSDAANSGRRLQGSSISLSRGGDRLTHSYTSSMMQNQENEDFGEKDRIVNNLACNEASLVDAAEQAAAPHSREFYLRLIQVEKIIAKGSFNSIDVTTLIEMYTLCIEFFDVIQDPIKCYFEDKISSALSTAAVLNVLMTSSTPSNNNHLSKTNAQPATQNGSGQTHSYSPGGSARPLLIDVSQSQEQGLIDQQEPQQPKEFLHSDSLSKGIGPTGNRLRTLSQQKKQERMKAQHNIDLIKLQQTSTKEEFISDSMHEELQKKVQEAEQVKKSAIGMQKSDIEDRLRARKEKQLMQTSERLLNRISSIVLEEVYSPSTIRSSGGGDDNLSFKFSEPENNSNNDLPSKSTRKNQAKLKNHKNSNEVQPSNFVFNIQSGTESSSDDSDSEDSDDGGNLRTSSFGSGDTKHEMQKSTSLPDTSNQIVAPSAQNSNQFVMKIDS